MKLSHNTTVDDYQSMERSKDKVGISKFILERFTERYITPVRSAGTNKHGFCTMAVSCLMVETLESFWQGEVDTKGKSKKMFAHFFARVSEFAPFQPHAEAFYENVRCGILHQAETRKGWRILRSGPLFDEVATAINATKFHNAVARALREYCKGLRTADWDSSTWEHLVTKMAAICTNSK